MREISVELVKTSIRDLCIQANIYLPESLKHCIHCGMQKETSPVGVRVLEDLCANFEAAEQQNLAICQDTGMAVIFLEIGQDVHFTGGSLPEAIRKGVAAGYREGFLRCSIVNDPLFSRVNTGDNTPPVVHTSIVEGDRVVIQVCPKGFGSENMSAIRMFTPSATPQDLCDFVVETVSRAGSNPCPPVVIGVGVGGNFESCALLAKRALCRDVSRRHPNRRYAELEQDMLERINRLGIGPQGFGGRITALAVNIEEAPTHIAGLPCAVNIGCHVTRHAEKIL